MEIPKPNWSLFSLSIRIVKPEASSLSDTFPFCFVLHFGSQTRYFYISSLLRFLRSIFISLLPIYLFLTVGDDIISSKTHKNLVSVTFLNQSKLNKVLNLLPSNQTRWENISISFLLHICTFLKITKHNVIFIF